VPYRQFALRKTVGNETGGIAKTEGRRGKCCSMVIGRVEERLRKAGVAPKDGGVLRRNSDET